MSVILLHYLAVQSLSKFSLVYILAWHPLLHTPYISSPNHCHIFAAHAHTITTCFAVVLRLRHLILVSLSTLYLELLRCSLMPRIHLTILISAFLTGQVSLPCNILLHTQLLYNLPLTVNDISLLVSNGTNVYTGASCTSYWLHSTSTNNVFITFYMLSFISLHFLCTHF